MKERDTLTASYDHADHHAAEQGAHASLNHSRRKSGSGAFPEECAIPAGNVGRTLPPALGMRSFLKSAARIGWKVLKVAVAVIFAVVTVGWVTVSQEWDALFKSPDFICQHYSASRWENTIEKYVRLHESKSYVESVMGIPQICESKKTSEQGVEFEMATYINPNFALFCVYVDETLKGFLVISSSENFRVANYRSDFTLLDDTIASASEKCDSNLMHNVLIAANFSLTGRLDSNAYYLECKVQHSAGGCEDALVGYGITDIGLWDFNQSVANLLCEDEAAFSPLWERGVMETAYFHRVTGGIEDNTREVRTITDNPDLLIRHQRVNAFFVFDADAGFGVELLRDSLMNRAYLGINKDRYSSFNPGYPITYRNFRRTG